MSTEKHQHTGDEDDWEHQPPYARAADTEGQPHVEWTGGCQCGRVRYEIYSKRPKSAKFCHCNTCQRMHGAPFQWAAIFENSQIFFVNGTKGLRYYNTAEDVQGHKLPCKVFCSTCLAPLMDEGRRMCMLLPSTIDFQGAKEEDKKIFAPELVLVYPNTFLVEWLTVEQLPHPV
ncbi:hypothetical protein KEM55_003583 [Ascosphaera atra]|nr:hypothetical protein KEM55_003583 [Ascosphaera atra]